MMKTEMPLVSIVIPAYNHADYLAEAIESVLNQDYPHVELIVLDDGSTDNTREVLEKYGTRFYWESQPNCGQANTLNKGWARAKGNLLGYLSADDTLLPQAISRIVQHLQAHPGAVLCYPDFQLIDSESRVIRKVSAPEYGYREMVTKFVCAPGPGALFLRSAYEQAGGWDATFRQYPDYEYWLRLGMYGDFVHLQEVVAAFRVHENSQTFAQTTPQRAEEALAVIRKYFDSAQVPEEMRASQAQAFANAHLMVAQLHLRAGRYGMSLSQMIKATKTSPLVLFSIRALRMLANGLFNRLGHKTLWILHNLTGKRRANE